MSNVRSARAETRESRRCRMSALGLEKIASSIYVEHSCRLKRSPSVKSDSWLKLTINFASMSREHKIWLGHAMSCDMTCDEVWALSPATSWHAMKCERYHLLPPDMRWSVSAITCYLLWAITCDELWGYHMYLLVGDRYTAGALQ